MANVGDKFIVEIGSKYNVGKKNENNYPAILYKIKGFNTLVFDDVGLRKMTPLNDLDKMTGEAYKDGEKAGYINGYEKGCEETLLLMKKIISCWYNLGIIKFVKIFNVPVSDITSEILMNVFNMPQDKLKACLDKYNDFEVGDEIIHVPTGQRMSVFSIEKDTLAGISNNGVNNIMSFYRLKKDDCIKTGIKKTLFFSSLN